MWQSPSREKKTRGNGFPMDVSSQRPARCGEGNAPSTPLSQLLHLGCSSSFRSTCCPFLGVRGQRVKRMRTNGEGKEGKTPSQGRSRRNPLTRSSGWMGVTSCSYGQTWSARCHGRDAIFFFQLGGGLSKWKKMEEERGREEEEENEEKKEDDDDDRL